MTTHRSSRKSATRNRNDAAAWPRVLSLKQPWAWAVASGKKKIENRDWSTPYRGTVYIHASTKLDRSAITWLRNTAGVTPPDDFVHGAVVAVVDIVDVITKRDAESFKPWFFGKYGFVLARIRALPRPIPEKGRLGLAKASPELHRRVRRALHAVEASRKSKPKWRR
jgi:ASCH domain-containing protein